MPDYALMNQYLYEGNADQVEQLTKAALAEGRSAQEVLNEGLIAGMSVVGEDFKHNVLYVPEVLIAARAMKAGMAVLKPLLSSKNDGTKPKGVLLMGTVRGDLHDIGKNLVGAMLEGGGFEVIDLGADVPPERFLQAAKEKNADIVALSALLTVTMPAMKTTIEFLKQAEVRDRLKVIVGGAPVTRQFAEQVGADAYGESATKAVKVARSLVGKA